MLSDSSTGNWNDWYFQGINLANIIKDLSINSSTGQPILNESIENLKKYISEKENDSKKLLEYLAILNEESSKVGFSTN